MAEKPPLIAGASRAAGVVGMLTVLLYVGLLIGAGGISEIPKVAGWSLLIFGAGAGLLAWFADRGATVRTGRRMLWAAFAIFFTLGVLSIFTIGVLFLLASVLCVYSLSRSIGAPSRETPAGEGR